LLSWPWRCNMSFEHHQWAKVLLGNHHGRRLPENI